MKIKNFKIPDEINKKLSKNRQSALKIVADASYDYVPFESEKVSFTYQDNSPCPELNKDERASSMVFMIRFESLQKFPESFKISKRNGNYYLEDLNKIRAVLNEYRTIFWNHNDPIYYKQISNIYRPKLLNHDLSKAGGVIIVKNGFKEDVTKEFIDYLDLHNRIIGHIIKASDFNYIFNGVLQHSDPKFSKRFIEDYTNGNLNYILMKNTILAHYIKHFFSDYKYVVNILNYPAVGSL